MLEYWLLKKAIDANLKKCSYCWFEILVAEILIQMNIVRNVRTDIIVEEEY